MSYSLLFFLLISYTASASTFPGRSNTTCQVYSKPGDVSFGGIFQFKNSINGLCIGDVSYLSLVWSEAMIWSIEEINKRTDILPNITIGYEIRDGCGIEDQSLWSVLSYYTDTCTSSSEYRDGVNLVAMVSAASSLTTVWMAKVGNLFNIPLVSATATSDELSDTVRFPYFFRSVPPDRFQVNAIVDIVLKFGWRYVGLIYTADTYGLYGVRQIKKASERAGVCIAMSAAIQPYAPQDEIDDAIDKLSKVPKAKVVILFALSQVAKTLLTTLRDMDLNLGITWIGSDGWGVGYESSDLADITAGSIFVRANIFYVPTPKFRGYLGDRDPDIYTGSPWFNEFWKNRKESLGCFNFTECPFYGFASASVINGVFALANALHTMYNSSCHTESCLALEDLSGEYFRQYLLNVSFEGPDGIFEFDNRGDTFGKYQVLNLQKHGDTFSMAKIGFWDARFSGNPLRLEEDKIQFVNDSMEAPFSLCIDECRHGQITIPLEEKCCYGCQACPSNAIVVYDDSKCQECPLTHWPDETHTSCRRIPSTDVNFKDPIVLVIVVSSACGLFVCLITAIGLWLNRNHALIKATSRELSAVNLLGIVLAFFDVFLLLIKPSTILCPIAESMISLCFTVLFAPTLLKIVRIYRIFRAGKKSVRRPRFVSVPDQIAMISVLIIIQVSVTSFIRLSGFVYEVKYLELQKWTEAE